jgi:hypothetical protein
MPFKVIKVGGGLLRGEKSDKLEDSLNELELQLDKENMVITNVSLSVNSQSADMYCIVQYTSRVEDLKKIQA